MTVAVNWLCSWSREMIYWQRSGRHKMLWMKSSFRIRAIKTRFAPPWLFKYSLRAPWQMTMCDLWRRNKKWDSFYFENRKHFLWRWCMLHFKYSLRILRMRRFNSFLSSISIARNIYVFIFPTTTKPLEKH